MTPGRRGADVGTRRGGIQEWPQFRNDVIENAVFFHGDL
jgi:hypothetical protein